MKRSPMPARRTPLRPKTRIKAYNTKRRAKKRERNFGRRADWIAENFPCCVPGCNQPSGPPHHVEARGMGGCKGDKRSLVPLCIFHHTEAHAGQVTFERKHNLHLSELAAHYSGLYEHSFAGLAGRPEPDSGAAPSSLQLSSPEGVAGSTLSGSPARRSA